MNKTLVAFFSASGTTKKIAEMIAEAANADLHEIAPKVLYTKDDLNWMNKKSRSSIEMSDKSIRPEIADSNLDMIDYTLNSIEPYTTQKGFKYIKKPYVAYEKRFNYAYAEFETNEPESGHIYFLQTVIETKEFVYQILQYCSFENQEIMKSDFVKIANSFKVE